jgi:hypothetical protein
MIATQAVNAEVERFVAIVDDLMALIEEETSLVRAGRLREAAPLERKKTTLAHDFSNATSRLNALNPAATAPQAAQTLRAKQERFHALLQSNQTVLATAHAVSEGILRGVSGELARKAAPSTYGATGRTNAPGPSAAQPLAVSRVL